MVLNKQYKTVQVISLAQGRPNIIEVWCGFYNIETIDGGLIIRLINRRQSVLMSFYESVTSFFPESFIGIFENDQILLDILVEFWFHIKHRR